MGSSFINELKFDNYLMQKESYDYGTGMLGIITTIYRLQNNYSSPFSFDKETIDSIKNYLK